MTEPSPFWRPLDEDALTRRFQETGRLHIPDFLKPDLAGALHEVLAADMSWARTFTVNGKSYDIDLAAQAQTPDAVLSQVAEAVAEGGRTGFAYDFELWRISDEVEAGRRPTDSRSQLADLYALLNSEVFLALMRRLTGLESAAYCDAQATRYRAGHFLTAHDDEVEGKNRLCAMVLGLTPVWRTEWGGLLLFHDRAGHVLEGYTPSFNALNLFRVPQLHSVSQVAGFVTADRLSVTGWVRSSRPEGDLA
ncbi:MAG: hypothetical protein CFE28_04875 [Alphaproteobacteria bacterium PA2]|nr:MAG: hypothetical protein CFE28_04875 [Alphaproteobacteria bacterium PA2]